MICDLSRIEFEIIYKRLGVTLEEYGESFYNKMIAPLIEDLEKKGFVTEDQGAKCIFVPKIKVPLIVQKSDGGFNYDSTDLAAIKYRTEVLKCDQLVYVVDSGQEFHFKQIFGAAQLCGIIDPKVTK